MLKRKCVINKKSIQTRTENVGETVIDKKPASSKESSKDVGDYVDYEEVKDDK